MDNSGEPRASRTPAEGSVRRPRGEIAITTRTTRIVRAALFATLATTASCGWDPWKDPDALTRSGGEPTGGPGGPTGEDLEDPPILGQVHPGDTVGEIEVGAPSVEAFVLRATLPLPKGFYLEDQGGVPFKIVDADGQAVFSQVSTLSRWPDPADGADVVEISARVRRPEGAAPGARLRYRVVYSPHTAQGCESASSVTNLLATPNAVLLRARDVFGNLYTTDLFAEARTNGVSLRQLKRGRALAQVATHQVLRPEEHVAGPQGTLPHLMGAHAYLTRYAQEGFVSLDLRIHNGFSGADLSTTDDDPVGKLYFDALELVVPAGFEVLSAFSDPFLGDPRVEGATRVYPIVAPIDGGALHMMPKLAQFERRLAIASAGSQAAALATLREETLGFCRAGANTDDLAYFSWWNPATARFFAQRHALPSLAPATPEGVRASLATNFANRVAQLASGSAGSFPIESANLGWAHPWGISVGGMVSGSEIYIFDGVDVAWSASTEGYRLAQLALRQNTDRQPNVLFNRDGSHTREAQWVVHGAGGDFLPIWWYNAPLLWCSDPFGYNASPTFQVDAVAAAGKQPWYEWELASFEPHDFQHLVRYTRMAKTLAWLGGDALAIDDLRAQAEGFRLGYSTYRQDLYGNLISTGMRIMQNYVANYPNQGICFGRGEGWGIDAMTCAYAFGDDGWRAEAKPWFDAIVDLVEDGQTECTGVIQATPLWNVFGAQYRCRQSIESAIASSALVGIRESVLEDVDEASADRLDAVLRGEFYAMISAPVWSTTHNGPWAMMGVGPFDMVQPPFCSYLPDDGNYGWADHYQCWSSFAFGYELTQDPLFLEKARQMTGQASLTAAMTSAPLDNWQNKAALLQLVQRLADEQP